MVSSMPSGMTSTGRKSPQRNGVSMPPQTFTRSCFGRSYLSATREIFSFKEADASLPF